MYLGKKNISSEILLLYIQVSENHLILQNVAFSDLPYACRALPSDFPWNSDTFWCIQLLNRSKCYWFRSKSAYYTHFKKFCLQKIFWKSLKSLNYWKERCFKRLDFWGSFWKSLCKIVTNNAFLIFFLLNRSKLDVESDCGVRSLKQRE